MRLAVIGTSNSILRNGYADALREDRRVKDFLRIGPGGSTSIILPYFGRDLDLTAFDSLIIDTSVNDTAFLGWGLIRPLEIRENLAWILGKAAEASCKAVVLCLPHRGYIHGPDDALEIYLQTAQEFGVPVLNGYELLNDYAEAAEMAVADLFTDDLHLRADVARQLAPRLIDMCQTAISRPVLKSLVDFRTLDADRITLPQQYRNTSLLEANCAVFQPGDRFQIPLAPNETVAGVAYNAGMTFGSLIFAGQNKVAINVRSDYYEKSGFVAAARQVSPAVVPQDGVVEMFLQDKNGPRAEIMGLLIRSQTGSGCP